MNPVVREIHDGWRAQFEAKVARALDLPLEMVTTHAPELAMALPEDQRREWAAKGHPR